MCLNWSIATFRKKKEPMSQSEFKMNMEFCGFETYGRQTTKFYKKYINDYNNNND